jgi:hypothetical protein
MEALLSPRLIQAHIVSYPGVRENRMPAYGLAARDATSRAGLVLLRYPRV